MNRRAIGSLLLALLALAACARDAEAAWPPDPFIGSVPLCAASGPQDGATIVADGAGGAIVAWHDQRGANQDIYIQRVDAVGATLWTANGILICAATGNQTNPVAIPDGSGVIVTWTDARSGSVDIYAQKVSAAGVPQWTANGVAICTATASQANPRLVSDGSGGAIIVWQDPRSGANDVYAQRINSAGVVQWTANGVAVGSGTGTQEQPRVVSDGAGGAILGWQDNRAGAGNYDIYAQRLNPSGVALWTANGVAVSTAAADQFIGDAVSDGAGGVILAISDHRGADYDIYTQRLNGSGAILWGLFDTLPVCTATADQSIQPRIVSDGSGGAILAWEDARGAGIDIYAQRVTTAGNVQWAANGVALCTATGSQLVPSAVADGTGGAIVTWYDYRNNGTGADIYAQEISSAGSVQWVAGGVMVSGALFDQSFPVIASDGGRGAFIAWRDSRSGAGLDIYAQRVDHNGNLGNPEPDIASVKDIANDQGGQVKVSWAASYLDAYPTFGIVDYRVWRSAPTSAVLLAKARGAIAMTSDPDLAAMSGRLLVTTDAVTDYFWEPLLTVSAAQLASYSAVAATTADSVAGSNPRTVFMVEARAGTAITSDRWFSAPDSGYSIDNLGPATPVPFTGNYAAGTTHLHWNPNHESDLAGYRLYRGSDPSFVPGPGNLIASPPDTGHVDAAGAPRVYKLTAVDVHGNESPVATLLPGQTTSVPGDLPHAIHLAVPAPHPMRSGVGASVRFALPRAGHVRLAAYDTQGRLAGVIYDGHLPAGERTLQWRARGDGGGPLRAGLYLLCLESGGERRTARAIVVD